MLGGFVRLFFRIGYLGDAFHGSQIQPDVKTVQGELQRVFRKLNWWDDSAKHSFLVLSSRTDAGVHVRMNGGIVTVKESLWDSITPRKFVRAVDDLLDDSLVFLDVHEVEHDWNPRRANFRTYRYMLEGLDFWKEPVHADFRQWIELFKGTHDFSNFAKLEPDKTPMRTVLDIQPWFAENRLIGFEITGESFLWNQVRRVANALFRLSLGELTIGEVQQALSFPQEQVDFGVAPPEWLILWGVSWDEFSIPPSTFPETLEAPPVGRDVERTRKKRWQQARQYELKMLLFDEWSTLGKFDYKPHDRG